MEEITRQLLSDRQRFLDNMPLTQDNDLIVLKGHLLIEELLVELIKEKLKYAEAFKEKGYGFIQKTRLAEALYRSESNEWYWKAIKTLNTIRNNLVHILDSDTLHKKLLNFVNYIETNSKEPYPRDLVKNYGKTSLAITVLFARLSALLVKTKQDIISLDL